MSLNLSTSIGLLERDAWELTDQAYVTLEDKYGKHGETPKPYHNEQHARDVVRASMAIANLVLYAKGGRKIDREDKITLILAAAYHDYEQNLGSGQNERVSAAIASNDIHKAHLALSSPWRVTNAILATQMKDQDGAIRQSADEDDYVAKILADADLSNLGAPTEVFQKQSGKLFNERLTEDVDLDIKDFLHYQTKLLTDHAWYTPEAARLFPHQEENLAFVQTQLAKLTK